MITSLSQCIDKILYIDQKISHKKEPENNLRSMTKSLSQFIDKIPHIDQKISQKKNQKISL